MSAIKIIHVITRLDWGGSTSNTVLSAFRLNSAGYEVKIISGLASGGQPDPGTGGRVTIIRELTRKINPFSDVAAFLKLYKIFRAESPDIIHTHTSKAGVLGRWAAFFCRSFSGKAVKIVHTPHGHVYYGYFSPPVSALYLAVEKISAKITDVLVAISEGEKRENIERGVGRPEQWVVIHSGVNINAISETPDTARASLRRELREQAGIPAGAFVAGTVGRLTAVKGLRYFIEAAKEVSGMSGPGIYCLIIGEGEEKDFLRSYAAKLGLDGRIIFAGFQNNASDWLFAMDIIVQPSLNEGMGRSLVEAAAAAIPAIASQVCGIPDIVVDGKTGILVPPRDRRALAQAIIKLSTDAGVRGRFALAAREWICRPDENGLAQFSVEAMIKKLEQLYSRLCQR